jgi:hypothetical protein
MGGAMSDVTNSPFGEAMASVDRWDRRLQKFLDDASMRGLCGKSFDEIEGALHQDIDEERDLYAKRQTELADQDKKTVETLSAEVVDIDRRIEEIAQRSEQAQKLELETASIAGQIADLDVVIRQKRRRCHAARLKAALDEIELKTAAANQTLSAEARLRDERHFKLWERVVEEFRNAATDAQKRIDDLDDELTRARQRIEPLVKKGVTRTVAGFLLWSGYLSFAAIGSAFAILFHDTGEKQSGLSHVLGIARALLLAFPDGWPPALRLISGVLSIVLGLAAFCCLVVYLDRTLQRFDRGWSADARRRGRGGKERSDAQSHFIVRPPGASTEIRRSAYVQLVASAPYVLITAVITLFAAAAVPAVSGEPTSGEAAAATTATTFIGTVLALLVTASLVMYVLKVLDRRERLEDGGNGPGEKRWADGWEFLVVPILLIITTLCATFRHWKFNIWGPVMLVMLFSCLAVAYGVIYSGMYKDITILERRKRHFVDELEELRNWSPPDPDETPEMRNASAIIEELRRRREDLLSAEWDTNPFSAPPPTEVRQSSGSFWRKADSTPPPPARIRYHEIAVSDDEAAPEDYASRRVLEARLRELQRLQRELTSVPFESIPALQQRRASAEQDKTAAIASLERANFERRRAVAEFDHLKGLWLVRLRSAYDAASLAGPILKRGLGES